MIDVVYRYDPGHPVERPRPADPASALRQLDRGNREFATLAPQLKETFFIGDGMTSSGARQSFVVPKGATRLYLATWDFYEWNNNAGSRTIKISRPSRVVTVK